MLNSLMLCVSSSFVSVGASSGIGREVALDMAKRGARVITASRDEEKGLESVNYIKNLSKNSSVFWKKLNLSDLSSVRQFAIWFTSCEQRLDILINNAAIAYSNVEKTVDGYDLCFGTNHLGHFLLTELLVNHLKRSAPARIVIVSSLAHILVPGPLRFDKGDEDTLYPHLSGYEISKLANILHAKELARRLAQFGVSANAVHPGGVDTELWKGMAYKWPPWFCFLIRMMVKPVLIDANAAAQTIVYAAVDDRVKTITGRYFEKCSLARESIQAKSLSVAKKLWEVSSFLTGLQVHTLPLEVNEPRVVDCTDKTNQTLDRE
ncbi:DgyrCDS12967 [Dimorphilus gyrociliatus]|uniref:DgyrCDS12967 n=1 Tax=Dimorphilus gyrociliatus TaxID=2664684 RepID=A0A7I8W9B7_9ANNE|nr:DgyrCDS12967 [Dimorphilus gyrociliatus]